MRFIPVHTGNILTVVPSISLKAVYPCAYREHAGWFANKLQYRFIPVHTGNIQSGINERKPRTVYPCAYREHNKSNLIPTLYVGLSLCIQGTYTHHLLFNSYLRFIPVHTGNIPIITYCFIIKILSAKFLPIF